MDQDAKGSGVSRRAFIVRTGAAAGLASVLGTGSPLAQGEPKRGGTLRIALPGAGTSETLDFNRTADAISDARVLCLYEGLMRLNRDGSVGLALAQSLEPNADASLWTARLHAGVTFHDGRKLTAEDVVWSFRFMMDEANGSMARSQLASVDPARLRALDDLTVEIGLSAPNAFLPLFLAEHRVRVVPAGTDSFEPAPGTGPFRLVSWTRGERSLFERNPDYRIAGKPLIDQLEMISIDDPTARVNALLAGQVDAIAFVDAALAPAIEANPGLVLLESPGMEHTPFVMQTDAPPFDDVRVRKAMRLIADREQLVNAALGGRGRVGNDLQSWADPLYNTDLPQRVQDIEQAKALLAEAGRSGLTVTLHTSDASGGMLESATVFAEQAKAAGVTVTLERWPADQFWSQAWMQKPFFSTDWSGRLLVPQFFMAMTETAPFNETRWKNAEWSAQLAAALAETDPDAQKRLVHALQATLHEEGGYIVWGFRTTLDAHARKVQGIGPSVFKPLGSFDFLDVWIDA